MTDAHRKALTERQEEVFRLVALGYTDKQIGGKLDIAYTTVRVHVVALAYRLRIPGGKNTRVLIANAWWKLHPNEDRLAA